jgi:predicted outer membrane repeat protein
VFLWTVALWACGPDDDVGIDTPDERDADGDGFSPDLGDCDDNDPNAYPGAPEVWCNGRLENCDGADGNFTVPTDVPTIADGLAAAGAGFTVCVAPGTYAESGLALTRFGVQLIGLPGGVATIDAGGASRGLDIPADDVVVSNLTIVGGVGLTEFEDLPGVVAGGGIRVTGDNVGLIGVTVTGSSAPNGGGIGALEAKNLRIEGGVVEGGVADAGGGVYLAFGDATITGLTVRDNTSTGDGGGLYATDAAFTLDALTVTGNDATGAGGGLHLTGIGPSAITGGTWSENTAVGNGGALLLAEGDLTVSGATFEGNRGEAGGAVSAIGDGRLTIANNVWTGNSAAAGGALHLTGGTATSEGGNTVSANSAAGDGGGVLVDGATSQWLSDTLEGNTALRGGGVYCAAGRFVEDTVTMTGNAPDQVGCGPNCADCTAR